MDKDLRGRLALAGCPLAIGCALLACSGEPPVNYGPPEGLKNATFVGPPAQDSGAPPVDSGMPPPPPGDGGGGEGGGPCAVSWAGQVHALMKSTGPYTCASGNCHGSSLYPPSISDDPAATLTSLKAYTMNGTDGVSHPYINPASMDPAQSTIECNLTPSPTNCGAVRMPNGMNGVSASDFATIDAWVKCGAPNN